MYSGQELLPINSHCCAETDIYVTDMLRCMRDVNVDNNNVGWYQSTYMNSWLDADGPTVETQYQFQVNLMHIWL